MIKEKAMSEAIDVINNDLTSVNISEQRYDDFIISEKLWNDIADLISIRAKKGKGISADEVRVIYDMHINYIDLKEKETE